MDENANAPLAESLEKLKNRHHETVRYCKIPRQYDDSNGDGTVLYILYEYVAGVVVLAISCYLYVLWYVCNIFISLWFVCVV